MVAPAAIKYFGWTRADRRPTTIIIAMAARREDEAGPGGRIPEALLNQQGQELRRCEQNGAGRQHDEETRSELARRHHSDVDHRIPTGDLPWDHEHER